MELRDSLLSLRRIKEVEVRSDFSYWKDDYTEFRLDTRREDLQKAGVTVGELYGALSSAFGRDIHAATLVSYRMPSRSGCRRVRAGYMMSGR